MARKRKQLANARKAAGLTQEELAARLGVERSTVARWEAGETSPQPWLRRGLAKILQIEPGRLGELLEHDEPRRNQLDDRMAFVRSHPTSVDLTTASQLRQQVRMLTDGYDHCPSTSLLAEAGQCLGQIEFFRRYAGIGEVARQLTAALAEAAILMGQLVWDASQRRDQETARSYFRQALRAAQELPDPAIEAHALLRTSYLALYAERNPQTGLAFTQRAAAAAEGASQALGGLAWLHTAEAHAILGERRASERALGEAEGRFVDIQLTDAAADLPSQAQFDRVAGSCFLFLRDYRRAQTYLERSVRSAPTWKKSRAISLGNLGLAYLRQGEIDAATNTLHKAIDVVEATQGGGGLTIIFSAGRELRKWRDEQQVQYLHDRMLMLLATM
ncbi:hypothetical protein GCM10012275_51670 [Longimycelium tulufanense]|uniref:HTH cro/C1-type domain-containing protein n=1 Tax=Longimycelium tulufanense TaxID=907463 RepID=A0A8J3CIQ1_9PSEU|nr:helix-turn-helix transcriptional regulator [Longimycelium tulufanense]GGM74643.1 hypothetical protein GCM10012275_51670 [Longimycelium tulufanense]